MKSRIGEILFAMAIVGLGVYALGEMNGVIAGMDSSDYAPVVWGLVEVMPIVYIGMVIVCAVAVFASGVAVYRYLKWEGFGNRLKEAYTAKFGRANPAFNEEVDMHIKAVRAMSRRGYTKDINLDWLKRIAEFVEVPWAIPEEEHLPEVEKTKSYE